LKKVAVVGAVGYGAYKVGQLSARLSRPGFGIGSPGYPGYGFNDWNRWRRADGFLCRNDRDCRWLDDNLECDTVGNFGWTISNDWFGGNAKPSGECSCEDGFEWDDDDLECERNFGAAFAWFGMGIIGFIIFIIVASCCCCGICCFVAKKVLG